MTTLKQPIFCHCDLSFGEHKVDKSFDGTIPFGLWIGVCFLIVVAVVGLVMGVAVYRGMVLAKMATEKAVIISRTESRIGNRATAPVSSTDGVDATRFSSTEHIPDSFTLDTPPSNPVINCKNEKEC